MLRAFAWLVSNVVSLSRTIFHRTNRDWHTAAAREDQLPTSNDITQETHFAENTGVSLQALILSSARSARPSKDERVLTSFSMCGHSIQSFRAKAQRAADPEPRSYPHHQHIKPLASGSRATRASGMTVLMCQKGRIHTA